MRTWICCGVVALVMFGASLAAQSQSAGTPPAIPTDATALEGSPTVEVETTVDATRRLVLNAEEAGKHGLRISLLDGRYFWSSHQNEELTPRTSGEFIYLMTSTPGQYVRLTRVKDRLTYVEHMEVGGRTVSYFGELRIVLGK